MQLPAEFLHLLAQVLPAPELDAFQKSLEEELPVSIRINPFKPGTPENGNPVPWTEFGYYLPERRKFTFDPLFHAGTYYVQEAGSMLLEQAMKQCIDLDEPLRVLDLCASPGGKSTHILSLISEDSIMVSNEVISSRIPALEQNLIQWGTSNTVLTQNDPAAFGKFSQQFDVLVVDAPCSGEGMFRKHDHAVTEWSLNNVKLCAARQNRILEDVWPALAEEGLLLYSTCTYNLEEDEHNLRDFLKEHGGESIPLKLDTGWRVIETQVDGIYGYRMIPHRTRSEGFFLSVIRKTEATGKSRKPKTPIRTRDWSLWKNWLQNPEQFAATDWNNQIHLFPKNHSDFLSACLSELRVRNFGIPLGEIKGKDLIPNHALALSHQLNQAAFPHAELSLEEAIRYLQREAITSPNPHMGIQVVSYQNHPLGFLKNLGNRANNLYPKNWRILSKHTS